MRQSENSRAHDEFSGRSHRLELVGILRCLSRKLQAFGQRKPGSRVTSVRFLGKAENLVHATRCISKVNIPTSKTKPKAANAMNKMAGIECVVQGRTARES